MASNKDKIDCIGKALLNVDDDEEEQLSLRQTIFGLMPFILELMEIYKKRKIKSIWKRIQARLHAEGVVIDLQLLQNYYHQAKRDKQKEAPPASPTTRKAYTTTTTTAKIANGKLISSETPAQGTNRPRRTVK